MKSQRFKRIYPACTAVVTEIAYHKEKTIAADVAFLGLKEWRDELGVLLDDLVDEDGRCVYPSYEIVWEAKFSPASSEQRI